MTGAPPTHKGLQQPLPRRNSLLSELAIAGGQQPLFPFPLSEPLGHFEDGNEHSKGQPVQCLGLEDERGRVSQDARPRLARGKRQFTYSNPQLLMVINRSDLFITKNPDPLQRRIGVCSWSLRPSRSEYLRIPDSTRLLARTELVCRKYSRCSHSSWLHPTKYSLAPFGATPARPLTCLGYHKPGASYSCHQTALFPSVMPRGNRASGLHGRISMAASGFSVYSALLGPRRALSQGRKMWYVPS